MFPSYRSIQNIFAFYHQIIQIDFFHPLVDFKKGVVAIIAKQNGQKW